MMAPQFQPGFAPYPVMPQQQPRFTAQPPAPPRWPAAPTAAPVMNRPVTQVAAPRPAEAPRPDVVRGVPASEPSFAMPAPEALNIRTESLARDKVDWSAVRGQLARIGATAFQLETLPQGGCRFTCQVKDTTNQPRLIEGRGADEAEAIQRCLAQFQR